MLITKDMLSSANGVDQQFIDDFEQNYPKGFSFNDKISNISFDWYVINKLAEISNYTGLYSCLDVFADLLDQINYVNGKIENLSNGNPAYVQTMVNGGTSQISEIRFYTNGKLQNPGKHLPALLSYYSFPGSFVYREFYENGLLDDPYPGVPALLYIDAGYNNKIHKGFYTNGVQTGGNLTILSPGVPIIEYTLINGQVIP